jgi:hypothetical protein
VVARQRVHDGLVERVAHVQRAGHIGGGSWMAKLLPAAVASAPGWPVPRIAGVAVAALFPLGAPMGFDGGGSKDLERLSRPGWEWCRSWLRKNSGMKTASTGDAVCRDKDGLQ